MAIFNSKLLAYQRIHPNLSARLMVHHPIKPPSSAIASQPLCDRWDSCSFCTWTPSQWRKWTLPRAPSRNREKKHWVISGNIPSGKRLQFAIEAMAHRNSGFTHQTWWIFPISFYVYQAGYWLNHQGIHGIIDPRPSWNSWLLDDELVDSDPIASCNHDISWSIIISP